MGKQPKTPPTLDQRIGWLSSEQSRFCLRVLVLAGYLTEDVLTKTLDLCDSVRFDL